MYSIVVDYYSTNSQTDERMIIKLKNGINEEGVSMRIVKHFDFGLPPTFYLNFISHEYLKQKLVKNKNVSGSMLNSTDIYL